MILYSVWWILLRALTRVLAFKSFRRRGIARKTMGEIHSIVLLFLLLRSVAGAGVLRLLLLVSLGFYEIESVSRQLSEEE